jgi:uncharacterized protein (TIGR04255 family)
MSASTQPQPKPDLADTPKFAHPPVVETALGIQFRALTNMRVTHYGRFQESLTGFGGVQEVARLPKTVEQKQPGLPTFSFAFDLIANPPVDLPRVWYLSDESPDGQQLVQLQPDRLVQNWRRKDPAKVSYTSYNVNKKAFEETYSAFIAFAKSENLGEIVVDQCDVTYINHIPIVSPAEADEAFKLCFEHFYEAPLFRKVQSGPEALGLSLSYWLDDLNGRLSIQAGTSLDVETQHQLISLTLVARGAPSGGEPSHVLEWLDLGHHYVVNAFVDITSPKMHQLWGREP